MKHEHTSYGFFCGGDPRRFTPDSDSSEEELKNHLAACAEWEKGETTSEPDCTHGPNFVLTRCQFGLGVGVYDCEDPDCEEAKTAEERIYQDPTDAFAAFQRWWDFDGQVIEGSSDDRQSIMRDSFAAGFKARLDLEEGDAQ